MVKLRTVINGLAISICVFATNFSFATSNKWQPLITNNSLEGWTPKFSNEPVGKNYKNTFQVKGNTLIVSYDDYETFDGKFGHLFFNQPYSDYRLRFEYRFTGEQTPGGPGWAFRNSGVMVHSQPPASMTPDQDFPASIEVQLLGQVGTKERPTGNVCTPGSHIVFNQTLEKEHCIRSSSKTYAGDGWVSAEIEVRNNSSIKHYIEGDLVMSYSAPQIDPDDPEVDTKGLVKNGNLAMKGGYFAFQAESHPVEFRNIQIMEIQE